MILILGWFIIQYPSDFFILGSIVSSHIRASESMNVTFAYIRIHSCIAFCLSNLFQDGIIYKQTKSFVWGKSWWRFGIPSNKLCRITREVIWPIPRLGTIRFFGADARRNCKVFPQRLRETGENCPVRLLERTVSGCYSGTTCRSVWVRSATSWSDVTRELCSGRRDAGGSWRSSWPRTPT